MLHFGKIPKKFGQFWRKFRKILANFANFWKKQQQTFQQFLTKILRLESGPGRREAQAVPAGPPPARGARAFCGGGSGAPRGRGVAVPEAARAGGGAAPLGRACSRAEGHRRYHPARPRGLAPRGRAAPRRGVIASGARSFSAARCGPRRVLLPRLGLLGLPARPSRRSP